MNSVYIETSIVSYLRQKPRIVVGRTLGADVLADDDEDKFCVSVRGVLKDTQQLIALVDLTTVLLDLLHDNGCLAADGP